MSTKTPNLFKPLVLAIVLTLVGGFAYWLEFGKKPKEAEIEADAKRVFLFKNDAISQLALRGASVKPENAKKPVLNVSLSCASVAEKLCKSNDASQWELTAPLKTKADDATVNGLVKNFANLTSTEIVDLSTETPEKRATLLKDYGLDQAAREDPRIRSISFTLENRGKFTAYFGVKHPISDGLFTLLVKAETPDENHIFVVPEWQLSVFDQKTSYFRDKSLFGFNEKEVGTFSVLKSKKINGRLDGKRSAGENSWSLNVGAIEFEGDTGVIDGVLSGIAHLNAKDVVAERGDAPDAKAALRNAKPIYEVILATKNGEKRLRLFETAKSAKDPIRVFAIVDGQDPLYEVEPYAAEKIEKTLAELRVGKLLNVTERYAITSIEAEGFGAEKYQIEAKKESSGKWKIGATETAPGKIEEILDRLSSKVIIGYSGVEPSGDFLRLKLNRSLDGKNENIAELDLWKTKERLFARNRKSAKKEIVELVTDFQRLLPWQSKTFFETEKKPAQ